MLTIAQPAESGVRTVERFDYLFERFYAELHRLTYRLVGEQAEDVLQEAFLKLAGAPVQQRPDEEVGAWLRRVCLNLGINRLRQRQRADERLVRAARLSAAGPSAAGPDAQALLHEQQAAVRLALSRLPDRQRECLLLRHSGYSYNEIAATLGVALGTVGVLLARAERAFRAVYQEEQHDAPVNPLS